MALISRSEVSRLEVEAQDAVVPLRQEEPLELSVVMPCLNEEETLATCIGNAQRVIADANIAGEVIVADNSSTDRSIEIAEQLGARVVRVKAKGYGNALMGGMATLTLNRFVFDGKGGAKPAERWNVGHRIRDVEEGPDGSLWMLEDAYPGALFHVTPK